MKPSYSFVTQTIENLTAITNEMLENADDFVTALDKYYSWLGDENIVTFCWGPVDYYQLWNEIHLKARHRTDLIDVLKSFVDLQKTFGDLLQAKKPVSLKYALEFCKEKFDGRMHSASCDAYNTAKILHRICDEKFFHPNFEYLYLRPSPEVELYDKNTRKQITQDEDFSYTIASIMSKELLEKFNCTDKASKLVASPTVGEFTPYYDGCMDKNLERDEQKSFFENKVFSKIRQKFACSKYDIKISTWIKFSVKVIFTSRMKVAA